MKKILFLLMSVTTLFAFSQSPTKSTSFEEPQGWSKVVQLKGGNTAVVEVTKKDGINVMMFDAAHKKVSSGKLALTMVEDKLGQSTIGGVFDIGGDLVIFDQTYADKTPVLIRIIIDGKTGKLKSEDKVAEVNEMTRADAYAIYFGDVDLPVVNVKKDPDSDYYALIRYNTLAPETKDRIEVLHYGPDHKVINKANYTSPDNKFKYTKYLDAYVHKDEYIVISTYAFNTKKSGGEEGRFYVSQLSKGKNTFLQKQLSYTTFFKGVKCDFTYNKSKNLIHMALVTDVEAKSNFSKFTTSFQNVNPATLEIGKPYTPDLSNVNAYYTNTMKRKGDFMGIIQGTFIDNSGNYTVFLQNTSLKLGNGAGVNGTFFGDVALVTMSPEGKTINSAVFPANIYSSGNHPIFTCSEVRNGVKGLPGYDDPGLANEQYFVMDMISTETSNYILFNNTKENMELPDGERPGIVKAISLATAVKYTYKNGAIKKEYLLKEPADRKDNEFCNFNCSDYNPVTKMYATLITDPKQKKTSVIWIKMD